MSPLVSLIGQALNKGSKTSTGSEVSPRTVDFTLRRDPKPQGPSRGDERTRAWLQPLGRREVERTFQSLADSAPRRSRLSFAGWRRTDQALIRPHVRRTNWRTTMVSPRLCESSSRGRHFWLTFWKFRWRCVSGAPTPRPKQKPRIRRCGASCKTGWSGKQPI